MEQALESANGQCHRTTVSAFESTLDGLLAPPAVGARLPFDDVSLEDVEITIDPTIDQLEKATTGVTGATGGITEYGSLLVPSTHGVTEAVSLFCDRHVAILRLSDLDGIDDTFSSVGRAIENERGSVVIETGPSATADMGGLVYGAHGPQSLECIVLEDA
jgi:L-lactate dehydrogenase complex protein LldG